MYVFGVVGMTLLVVSLAQRSMFFSRLFGLLEEGPGGSQTNQAQQFTDRERRVVTVGEHALEVEVVASAESTAQGLSGREAIGADGMLFVFPEKGIRHFWMPDMQFDIDIVWIDDTTVVGVTENVPKPLENQKNLPTYSSSVPVNRVLELPSGKAKELSIVSGTTVSY